MRSNLSAVEKPVTPCFADPYSLQDLKSPNILLTREGTAKVSDVGFANILSNTHLSNNATAFTFAWAAPEVRI